MKTKFVEYFIPLWLLFFRVVINADTRNNNNDKENVLALIEKEIQNPLEPNPRLVVRGGHLLLLTGRNKDLTFRTSGSGRIKLNGDVISTGLSSSSSSSSLSSSVPNVEAMKRQLVLYRVSSLYRRLQSQSDALNVTIGEAVSTAGGTRGTLSARQLRQLVQRVQRLQRLLETDDCASAPCQNGGVCEDGFGRFVCRCPAGFQGPTCAQDVDECAHYRGTELDCQNGGTCLNTRGSFYCVCPIDFHGPRCASVFNDCTANSSPDSSSSLCGKGVCVELPRTANGTARYRCVCSLGFAKSQPWVDSAPCDRDQDECALGLHRCSRAPPVACVNTRGGYTCGPCPPGFDGDGYRCWPTAAAFGDRCALNNGGCSTNPMVACHTVAGGGRVVCGRCPSGFTGDGVRCTAAAAADSDPNYSVCTANNGGCDPRAVCRPNPAISVWYRDCICPPGYTGSGVVASGGCRSSPASSTTTTTSAVTLDGACASDPCQNGGVCVEVSAAAYHCICPNEFTGRTCDQPRGDCGGQLDSGAGILGYPLSNESSSSSMATGSNRSCVWLISNSNAPGKVLSLTFTGFRLPPKNAAGQCSVAYVQLFDGPSHAHPSLGRFCGTSLPVFPKRYNNQNNNNNRSVLITTYNSVLLHYWSTNGRGNNDQFGLNWITTEPICGNVFTNISHGTIQSPGFPNPYPTASGLDCRWMFHADFGRRWQFLFTHLNLDSVGANTSQSSDPNCTAGDFVDFTERHGRSLLFESEPLERFCNWSPAEHSAELPPPVVSVGNDVRVRFVARNRNTVGGQGFALTFQQVPGRCGGLVTGLDGVIGSPRTSEQTLVCDWLIRVLTHERVQFRFTAVGRQAVTGGNGGRIRYDRCNDNYVKVFDGDQWAAPVLTNVCFGDAPPSVTLTSTGRYMRVRFYRSTAADFSFEAQWNALCGEELTAKSGVIESPNYPQASLFSSNCTYVIRPPPNRIVQLQIESVDCEESEGVESKCNDCYLQVDGERYCSSMVSLLPPIFSTSSSVRVGFANSRAAERRSSFRVSYRTIVIGCGGVVRQSDSVSAGSSSGSLSTNSLVSDPIVDRCVWELKAVNQSFVAAVTFRYPSGPLKLTNLGGRVCDFATTANIMVNDTDGSLIHRFCVHQLPTVEIQSFGDTLFVTYVFRPYQNRNSTISTTTNSTISTQTTTAPPPLPPLPRFWADYRFPKQPTGTACGGNLFSTSGRIASPQFPRFYPPSRNCTWVVQVPNGLQVALNITTFALEREIMGKCFDYLELRNGPRPDSPLIGRYCGRGPLPHVRSHGNSLWLRLVTDVSIAQPGFELTYEAFAGGCGGLLTGASGALETPDQTDAVGDFCEWRIRLSAGSRVELTVETPDGQTTSADTQDCLSSAVTITLTDSSTNPSAADPIDNCRFRRKTPVVLSTNQIRVRFDRFKDPDVGRIRLSYRSRCTGELIVGRFGALESPNFPLPYPHNVNCSWRIRAPMGNTLTVRVTTLHLERNLQCLFDRLTIDQVVHNATTANETIVPKRTLCGNLTTTNEPITIDGNEAVVRFISDRSMSGGGFRLEWAAVGCGAELRHSWPGNFSSPGYPASYPRPIECLWTLKAGDGRRVDLTIRRLELQHAGNCDVNYVQVFAGPDDRSPVLAKLCNEPSTAAKLSSMGAWMTVKLVYAVPNNYSAFLAEYRLSTMGCGGLFTTTTGTISSPDFRQLQQQNSDGLCTYRLVATNSLIELHLTDFDELPSPVANCSQTGTTSLTVFDSSGVDYSKQLAKVCSRSSVGSVWRSTGSELTVAFRWNSGGGRGSPPGFVASFRQLCGGLIRLSPTTSQRLISSVGYPSLPPNLEDWCHFVVVAEPESARVRLQFVQVVNLRPSTNATCDTPTVRVWDGDTSSSNTLVATNCADRRPEVRWTQSTGDRLVVETRSAFFQAKLSTMQSSCGGAIRGVLQGTVTSPNFPLSYPLNTECIWTLIASSGNRFDLTVDTLDLETSDYCNGDYLEIRAWNSTGPLIGGQRLCGSRATDDPLELDTAQLVGSVWIKFRSDEARVGTGFVLNYRTATRVLLGGDSGVITSPGLPAPLVAHNTTFVWSIVTADPNKVVRLDFDQVQLSSVWLDPSAPAAADLGPNRLSVYNLGLDQWTDSGLESALVLPAPIVTFTTTIATAPPVVSATNIITLVYFSPAPSRFPICFQVRWSAVNQSTASLLEDTSSDQSSPILPGVLNRTRSFTLTDAHQSAHFTEHNFTDLGGSHNPLTWYITGPTWMHLNVSVEMLWHGRWDSCSTTHFELHQWNTQTNQWRQVAQVCGTQDDRRQFLRKQYAVDGSWLRVRLRYQVGYLSTAGPPAFNVTVWPVCGRTITAAAGNLTQRDVVVSRSGDGSADECRWHIRARPGRTIRLVLRHYSIRPSVGCGAEYIVLRNGGSATDSPIMGTGGPICGQSDRVWLAGNETSGNEATVVIRSVTNTNSFLLEYSEVSANCGGELVLSSLTSPAVNLTTPGYPGSLSHEVTCEWIVRGPVTAGLQIGTTVDAATGDSFSTGRCGPDSAKQSQVLVYDGASDLSPLIGRHCGSVIAHMLADSNVIFVRYIGRAVAVTNADDGAHTVIGRFQADVRPAACNRAYSIVYWYVKVQLPPVGQQPLDGGECTAHLRTAAPHTLVLQFSSSSGSLRLRGTDCASGEVLEVRTPPPASTLMVRVCAHNQTRLAPIRSSGQELVVVYRRVNFQPELNTTTTTITGGNSSVTPPLPPVEFMVVNENNGCKHRIDATLQRSGSIYFNAGDHSGQSVVTCDWLLTGVLGTGFRFNFDSAFLGAVPYGRNRSNFQCATQLTFGHSPFNASTTYDCHTGKYGFRFPGNRVYIRFRVDTRIGNERYNFRLRYDRFELPSQTTCVTTVQGPRAELSSANLLASRSSSSVASCVWTLVLDPNSSGTIVLDHYDVPPDAAVCGRRTLQLSVIRGSRNVLWDSDPLARKNDVFGVNWRELCLPADQWPQVRNRKYLIPLFGPSGGRASEVAMLFTTNTTTTTDAAAAANNNTPTDGQFRGLRGQYQVNRCGGYYSSYSWSRSDRNYTSPDYPQNYQQPTYCHWYFGGDWRFGASAVLTFDEFDLDPDCDVDYFLLKPDSFGQSITKLCGRDGLPAPIHLVHVLVTFVSSRNMSVTGNPTTAPTTSGGAAVRKFRFRITAESRACGGVVMRPFGILESPLLNDALELSNNKHYAHNAECVWTVRPIADFHLVFTFGSRFDLEQSANCSADYLLFEEQQPPTPEASDDEWRVLARLCGHQTPAPITTVGSVVRVTFRSNHNVTGDGFRVSFRQECGALLTDRSGTVTSPSFADGTHYAGGLNCVYRIELGAQDNIRLEFDTFELEQSSGCRYDHVTVYFGDHRNASTRRLGPFCGRSLPPVVTVQHRLELVFHTDFSGHGRGFRFRYSVTACGGDLGAPDVLNGVITAPEATTADAADGAESAMEPQLCEWRITVPKGAGNSVAVWITGLDFGSGRRCLGECCAALSVLDGVRNASVTGYWMLPRLALICGAGDGSGYAGTVFRSTDNQMTVRYYRSGSVPVEQRLRFAVQWWATPGPSAGCGGRVFIGVQNGTVEGRSTVISSPDLNGDSYYEPGLSCVWTLSMGVPEINTESKTTTTTTTGDLYFELEFERFDLEESSTTITNRSCTNDRLLVYGGNSEQSPLLATLCGRIYVPEKIRHPSLLLHFISNTNAVTGHGFRARVTVRRSDCGGQLASATSVDQTVSSPGYPSTAGLTRPLVCRWLLVEMFSSSPLTLTVHDLDLDCGRGDRFEVRLLPKGVPLSLCSAPGGAFRVRAERQHVELILRLVGTLPGNLSTTAVQNKSIFRGFNLTYHNSECEPTIEGLDNGWFSSRNYPDPIDYSPNSDPDRCVRTIRVPADLQLSLYFQALAMPDCALSNLTVSEDVSTGNSTTKVLALYCNARTVPPPLFTGLSALRVTFSAAGNRPTSGNRGKPYSAKYAVNFVASRRSDGPPGCGGNVTSMSAAFSSPGYPSPPGSATEKTLDCVWTVHSGGVHRVQLRFEYFALSLPCEDNYLAVYDGFEQVEQRRVVRLCGQDQPAVIVSESSALLVRLVTAASNVESGFLAQSRILPQETNLDGRTITVNTFRYNSQSRTYIGFD